MGFPFFRQETVGAAACSKDSNVRKTGEHDVNRSDSPPLPAALNTLREKLGGVPWPDSPRGLRSGAAQALATTDGLRYSTELVLLC